MVRYLLKTMFNSYFKDYTAMKKNAKIFTALFLILSFLTSCIDFDTFDYDEYDHEYDDIHNELDPNANQLILDESIYGHPDKETSIDGMVPADDGGYFFFGIFNLENMVGKISASGSILWRDTVEYLPKGILNYKGNALVCGSFDKDNDDLPDAGILELFNSQDGNMIKKSFWVDFDNTRFNGISDKYIIGRCREGNSIHPFIAKYYIDENDSIIHGEIISYPDLYKQYFHTIDQNYISGGKFRGQFDDITTYEFMVYKFNESSLGLEWSKSIISREGFETSDGDIMVINNTVYVAGNSEVEEENPPYNADYWTDGLLASLTPDGQINYIRTYNTSLNGDKYFHLYYDGSYIYASGKLSSYWLVSNNHSFSYGLISKIDAVSGNAIDHYAFGPGTTGSGICALIPLGSGFVFGGWTNQSYYDFDDETQYQGWFVEIGGLTSLKTVSVLNEINPDDNHLRQYAGRKDKSNI